MITLEDIQDELVPQRNLDQAKKMEKYMRNQFPFLGIKTPERRKATQTLIKSEGFPD
ncbi:MAG: DNA alkylation repair protein, partial [Anaerobacillus sp.]